MNPPSISGPFPPGDAGEARFRQMADAAPFPVWVAGADALCTWFNEAWLAFRGRRLEEETGNGWTEGIHGEDREVCIGTYLRAFSAREGFRVQYRMRGTGGEYRRFELSGTPCFGENGRFEGFIGCAQGCEPSTPAPRVPDEAAMSAVCRLTERERQVLTLIVDGDSTRKAAEKLGITYKTADSHRSRILEKLGVHETASMVRIAIRAGLIDP